MEGKITKSINEKGVGVISFYHPAHNSMPGYLLEGLENAILEFGKNETVRVILLESEGDRTFCAGASFDELITVSNEVNGKAFFMGFARVINALRTCRKITVARVQGKAVGGGVGICAAVDYAIASKWASIKLSELTLGIGPFVIGPAVERKMGKAVLGHMTLNASEWQTAHWAKEKGLFQEVFDTREQMDAYISEFTVKLAGYNPEAMVEVKNILWEGTDHWTDLLEKRAGLSGRLVLSEYAKKALQKIKEKKA
ncbi:enoyl-CoA hydratase/isomerase family protein [Membranihabitans maritimus]|uniref:enoyl-CoA hydratase/isomerase family protein n=1 Tax=Membranihabitans maritimus TaxID=2904244 RepID=UPI001F1D46AB|nr:enoyl-CoA hydratase/isomerase family protein [Membranihabitans maritimus]